MSDPSSGQPVPPGTMLLYDKFDPPLAPGSYVVTVTTNVTEDASPPRPLATYSDSTHVSVAPASDTIGPNDVVMVQPPANSTGAFAEELPHIVLRRPTLPWESQDGTPWLALLVLDPSALANGSVTITDSTVLPQSSDLPLLCHVREISVDASDPTIEDGRFAVVVANRLPAPSGQQLACLVSTAGMVTGGTPPGVSQTLLVLYSWSFTVAEGGGFEEAMRAVATNASPVGLSQAAPLSLGRVARDGTATQAHYRGPLVGSLSATGASTPDPSDLSYQIASQLGAQLAAANRDLLRQLYDWRRLDQIAGEGPTLSAELAEAPLTAPSPAPARQGSTPASIVATGLAHLPALTDVVKGRRSRPSAVPALASYDVAGPGQVRQPRTAPRPRPRRRPVSPRAPRRLRPGPRRPPQSRRSSRT